MLMTRTLLVVCTLVAAMFAIIPYSASAASDCTFTITGETMTLDGDCTADETIFIPDGMTIDGDDHTITAVDPVGGHFTGAIIQNDGAVANVKNVKLTTSNLANVCDGGNDRLRGIMFEGASGSISHNEVLALNQGASGCQEGNAIEVRNAPFDGTHPDTQAVKISHNTLSDWQKTGIVANGDVDVDIQHNDVNESATQDNLAPNSIQLGFGATGTIIQNNIEGSQWKGTSNYASAAILIYNADNVDVSKNIIKGNSDIGIYIFGNNGNYSNNKVFDEGTDHQNSGYDYGIGNWGIDNKVTNNKVKGFDVPYEGVTGGKNKSIPGPQPTKTFF